MEPSLCWTQGTCCFHMVNFLEYGFPPIYKYVFSYSVLTISTYFLSYFIV